jgi:alpha-L-rhamnosidase
MRRSAEFNRHLVLWCHVVGIALAFLGCSAGRSGDNLETSFHALTVDPNAIYTIAGVASGECVQIAGLSLANSARAQLSTCSASASQQFRFSQVAGGYYNIVNAASGKCLDVQSKSTANGAAIIQYTCNGGTNQQWSITTNTNGSVRLTARHSGKVMEANQGGTADGTYIVQWAWSGAAYQQFQPATGGTGGAGGSGGATSSGGMTSSGGTTGVGGTTSAGGTTGSGGTPDAGGPPDAAGTVDAGGPPDAAGTVDAGGTTATGGSAGGIINGGATSSGGTSTGGISTGVGGSTSSGGNAPLAPTDLNIADRAAPLSVEGTALFGWVPNDPDGNEIQSAYQIQVTRVSDSLVIWDSGKVPSSVQSFVAYAGPTLAAGTSFTWTVRTWDRTDLVSPWAANVSFDTGLGDADWQASWIRRTTTESDDYTLARRQVTLGASPVTRARAYVSAYHQYELHLNGAVVDRGPAFSYPGEGYYQATDITAQVQAGAPLAIGIIYHWYGAGQGRPAGQPGLLGRFVIEHADGTREVVVTDGTWHVRRASQWQTGAPQRNSDGGDYVERIDSRQVPDGWDQPGYADTASPWTVPQVVGVHPAGVFTHVSGQEPRVARSVVAPLSVKTLSDGAVVADFGSVMPARPDVRFQSGVSGRTLNILTGYQLTSDGHVSTTTATTQGTDMSFRYIERAGAQEFQAFTYLGWRYLQISAPGETLSASQISAVVEHSDPPAQYAMQFASSDATVNAVFALLQRSALYSAQQQFLDTPTREKGQFLGDAVNESYATMAGLGERCTTRKAIREFIASQARYWTDGRVNAVYPNGDGKRDIPDYTEMFPNWVLRYYQTTGDTALLTAAHDTAQNVAEYVWRYVNSTTGLVTNLAGGSGQYQYGIIDWPAEERFGYDMNTTARATVNILAVDVMRSMAAIAAALGRAASEVSLYQGRADQLTTAINAKLRRADGMYIDGLTSTGSQSAHASQIANSYAVGFGVAPSSSWSQISSYVAGLGMQQGPMTAHWLLKSLHDAGRPDQVIARLTDQTGLGWANILAQGGSFTWESWTAPALGESESHGWGAQALVDIVESLLGLQVTGPGASAILIAPPATGLSSANGAVRTERGTVQIAWSRPANGGLTLDLTVPVNVGTTVMLPVTKPASTSASGAGRPTFVAETAAQATYVVGSGQSSFIVAN